MAFGGGELLIVLFIILLLFGARKLPELANSVGKSIKEFRKATEEENAETVDDTAGDDGAS